MNERRTLSKALTASPVDGGDRSDSPLALGPLHHVTVAVSDVDRSVAFYRDVLGLRPTLEMSFDDEGHQVYLGLPEGASGRAVALRSGRAPAAGVTLVQFAPGPTQPLPHLSAAAGVCLLAFELESVDAVDAAHERVVETGHAAVSEPRWAEVGSFGRLRGVTLRDPDGFLIELYAPEGMQG